MEIAQKMFNCPACGPVEICFIHGDWANKTDYEGMVFEMTRPSFETFNARVSDRSSTKPDGLNTPRILADIEDYAESQHKFQCSQCGKIFVIPKKAAAQSAVTGGPATLGPQPGMNIMPNPSPFNPPPVNPAGVNRSSVYAMFDNAFSESDLDTIITDMGEDPNNWSGKADKIDFILDCLY